MRFDSAKSCKKLQVASAHKPENPTDTKTGRLFFLGSSSSSRKKKIINLQQSPLFLLGRGANNRGPGNPRVEGESNNSGNYGGNGGVSP